MNESPHAPRRIGLFGGTFDPVHDTHLALAATAQTQLQLDEVRWIPAGQPWQKQRTVTPAHHRAAMVRAAIAGHPGFVLDAIELDRPGPSYTLETVRALQASAAAPCQWFLLLGQDQYLGLPTWHGWQELLQRVTLAVARRPGERRAEPAPALAAAACCPVALALSDVSSSAIRDRVAAGLAIDSLVPAAVARYIEEHGLYRPAVPSPPNS